MKAVGMVVEYNPFHNGHRYHLQQAKKISGADVTVAVMSGNFTQRGEPTIVDKWSRARTAVMNGVDLVIELPVFYAVQPAHRFAGGALSLLNALGVDSIVFGSEHPEWDFAHLVKAEEAFNQESFNKYNATYATQFNQQLKEQTGVTLIDPNDILAFAYTKAKINQGYHFELLPIKRQGSNYHDQQIKGKIASASAIRQAISEKGDYRQAVPQVMGDILATINNIPSWTELYPLLRNQLIQAPISTLQSTYLMAEGLEYRMKEAAQRSLDFNSFMKFTKTKRYTYAHLLRVCLYTILQITQEEVDEHSKHPYLHVLAFNKQGREYLHQVKKQLDLPLITKVDQEMRDQLLNLDYRAGKLYQLFTPIEQDLKHPPIIINS
ncbi:nucleotidyltransferase [Lactobacillus reuteri]|uniref:nucleotidyltransferase n=3 Tax=Limosilactobacillus reuteri TaxID=1598 RepID=UPI00146C645D|nr:nucleotidyltransferase [Limosilactobacillus reuteri]NMV49492.1 nucleotidyltransferase [Limosilactobacillus reuteri]NMV51145.1 nucleotidyltransferase [Limosilactobacillus reuteri]NMV60457.1 nucleotidyltransferase [Limosilactobacillus reuteri]NMV62251.1 nucleotidyltransferase [Limosilactobacillus reuteri]NMV64022.1 nucleotidyltransferase [Limosilactobacillus reuteri]